MTRPALGLCAGLTLIAGCGESFQSPSRVDTLRVLAVEPSPASGTPGQSAALDLVVADGVHDAAEPRSLEIAWLGGCHNPPGRQYFGCLPLLTQLAQRLASPVADTPVASGFFGLGSHFELPIPEDILTRAPRSPRDPVHFGVSYAFFAACAGGRLMPRTELQDRVPLVCVDANGVELGRRDFVTGFATLFTYEGEPNHNPRIQSLRFGELTIAPCATDSDCQGGAPYTGFEAVCLSPPAGSAAEVGECAPKLKACSGKDCPKFLLDPELSADSVESFGDANEVMWANYYGTAGHFSAETELVNDVATGFIADHGSFFHPPESPVGSATLWVTVNDQRGGATVRSLHLLVEE